MDRGLRTRRFLDYRAGIAWAQATRPVLVDRVILNADDSSGLIGDLARDLLELHARTCGAGSTDPVKLARWMFRFRFVDQDCFEADPVRYAHALDERGLAEFRKLVASYEGRDEFAVRYARERLAVLDGDRDEIIRQLGGDLSAPYHFIRVAEAMAELDDDETVIVWATRGIEHTSGWQVAQLYDLACDAHGRRGSRYRCQRCDVPSMSARRRYRPTRL